MNDSAINLSNARPKFERSIEVRLLVEKLRQHQRDGDVGTTVRYEVFGGLIGEADMQRGRGYTALRSARAVVQREDGAVWDPVPSVGLQLLSQTDIIRSAPASLSRVRRAAARGVSRLQAAASDTQGLSNDDRALAVATMSALNAVRYMAKSKSIDRVRRALAPIEPAELPIARTLALFRGPKG